MESKKLNMIKKLTEELNKAKRDYFNTGRNVLSDTEYDIKLKELERLEKECNYAMSNSPVNKVGSEVITGQKKIAHTVPMLSLEKVHSAKEIIDFAEGQPLVAMYKMDGISLRAIYNEQGDLVGLESRGNGVEGTDLFYQRYAFENLPLHINVDKKTIVDGEAIITDKDFESINNALPESDKYAHSRNLAAGSLALLDTSISSKRHLKMIVWDVIQGCDEEDKFDNRLEWAKDKGFDIVGWSLLVSPPILTEDEADRINELLMNEAKEDGYGIDGIVWKLRSVKLGKSKGKTEHHFCNAVAWKPKMEAQETILRDIVFETSKTGRINPVAIFDEIDLDGALTTRCTLNNISFIEDLELGIGDKIQIIRSNMVIPKIIGNLTRSNTFVPPTVCPCCGGSTEIIQQNESKVLVCTNPDCQGKLLGKLSHFVSRDALNIDGFSEATLQKFIDLGWLNSFEDIFFLFEHEDEMKKLPGFGNKSVDKLFNSIDAASCTTLDRFLNAISIYGVGKGTSKDLAKYCHGDLGRFYEIMTTTGAEEFKKIPGFGDTMAEQMNKWWEDIEGESFLDGIMHVIVVETPEEQSEMSSEGSIDLSGQTFCITGKVVHFTNRDAFISSVEAHNGKYLSGVSAKLDWLVNNDVGSTSGKNKKMHELGKTDHIISEQQYLKMIGEL